VVVLSGFPRLLLIAERLHVAMSRFGAGIPLLVLLSTSACGSSQQDTGNNEATGGVYVTTGTGGRTSGGGTGFSTGGRTAATGGTRSLGTGGRLASTGGSVSSGGASIITGIGGATSTTCQPADMSSFVYPAYVSAQHMAASCTSALAAQYYTDCFSNGNCTDFQAGGAYETCGACLTATPLAGSSQYGPLLLYGSSSASMYELNLAGCIELMGEAACAAKYQVAQLCAVNACVNNCPISDQASLNALLQCTTTARTTVCAAQQAATNCIANSATVTSCTGATFQAQFLALATVFCVM